MKGALKPRGVRKCLRDREIVEYRCACSEVLVQTNQLANITPERVQEIECPRCHARYRAIARRRRKGQWITLQRIDR